MLNLGSVSHRYQLGELVRANGVGVEVGTHRGVFADALLRSWGGFLYCVDPWTCPAGYEKQRKQLADSTGDRDEDYRAARRLLERHGDRVKLLRTTSAGAVGRFKDGSLDLVYVDGDHREAEVRADLLRWWPRVRRGGILAGHDFVSPGEQDGGWARDVQAAVIQFADGLGLDVNLVIESRGDPWSFYLRKE